MDEFKIKGQARAVRLAQAKFKPQGGVSRTIAAQTGVNAGKAMAKAMAKVKISQKGGK